MAGKTEWEDVLIKHKIIPAPPVVPTEDELQLEDIEKQQAKDPLADKKLEELDELEDDVAEQTMAKYREKRLAQLKEEAKLNKFGVVVTIAQSEFVKEVSQAGDCWVVCHLFVAGKSDCQLLTKCMESLAAKFKAVKFVRIVGSDCIPNFPDKNCPTLLLYNKSEMKHQIVGLDEFCGLKTTPDCLEWVLGKSYKALTTDLETDPREALSRTKIIRGQAAKSQFVGKESRDGDSSGSDDD